MALTPEQGAVQLTAALQLLSAVSERKWRFSCGPHVTCSGFHAGFRREVPDDEEANDDDDDFDDDDDDDDEGWYGCAHGHTLAEAIANAYVKALGEKYTKYHSKDFPPQSSAKVRVSLEVDAIALLKSTWPDDLAFPTDDDSPSALLEILQEHVAGREERKAAAKIRDAACAPKSANYPMS